MYHTFDADELREIMKGPGSDTRAWVSYGTVEIATDDQPAVRFNDDAGEALPHGVLVDVKLRPSGVVVPCRVMNQCAGNGEAEWHPFVSGDEVLVGIPGGDERQGCVILGRLNQAIDVFPREVAGMDVTQNTVAFKRLIPAYAIESGTAIALRCANTGATITIDPTGQVFIANGDGASLVLAHDAISLQLRDLAAGFQIDPSKVQATAVAGSTALIIDDQQSELQTSGFFSVSTGGNGAAEHVTTTEAVVGILVQLGIYLTTQQPGPLTGAILGPLLATSAGLGPILALASKAPLLPDIAALLLAGFALPKIPGTPGLGCPGFIAS